MSWTGTVTCSQCYKQGHNITSCPELKKAWTHDPGSWLGQKWAAYQKQKAQPKTCGYCEEEGHTRAGCVYKKRHKQIYGEDLLLFRQAMAKWSREEGPKPGALIRIHGQNYHKGDRWVYKDDDDYISPVGILTSFPLPLEFTHYLGMANRSEWLNAHQIGRLTLLGAEVQNSYYSNNIYITFPNLPGLIPRYCERYGGRVLDRRERLPQCAWEIVSPGHGAFETRDLVDLEWIQKATKEHFQAAAGNARSGFREFTDEQRIQMRRYINGDLSLSEMKDPELPQSDS